MADCFLCRRNNFKLKYALPGKNILECQNDHLFIGLNKKKSAPYYNQNYFNQSPYPNSLYQSYFQRKIELIERLTGEKMPNILEVGCGWGKFLELVEKNNLPYKGIDVSGEAVKLCRSKKFHCEKTTVEQLAKKERRKYSAITGFQIIEHMADPTSFLRASLTLLKKNGVILLTTPNNDSPVRKLCGPAWSVYNTESHFVFYNDKTLKKVLEENGFKNISVKKDQWRYLSFGYIMTRLKIPLFNNLTFPVPTDPLGDLMAIGFKK